MLLRSPRILVVDDLPDAADRMAQLLNLSGFDCDPQHSGAAALISARKRWPAVVLLDLVMPRMNGLSSSATFARLLAAAAPRS